jgi:geranylgeranyl diphosphate synthase type II
VTSTSEQLGKTPGKDQTARKATYPALYGLEASRLRASALIDEATKIISSLTVASRALEDIARFIIARSS